MNTSDYLETDDKLKIRIHAHTAYANFQLEDWLSDWLANAHGRRLLEMGCGNGNFFTTYGRTLGQSGFIIGCDINRDLLRKARENSSQLATPVIILPWDFDTHPYPLLDEEVDILTAPFCAYYTNDVSSWIEDSLRVVKSGGRLLLLGPTRENARELYELNEMITGVKTIPETDETSTKLDDMFVPELLTRSECNVSRAIVNREIIFPTSEEFARYYFATWLYEKTMEKIAGHVDFRYAVERAKETSLRLNKQIICIEAFKL